MVQIAVHLRKLLLSQN